MNALIPDDRHDFHKVYYYFPVTDAVSRRMHESLLEHLKSMHIDYAAIKNMIYCGVTVKKPLLSPIPDALDLPEILSASPLLTSGGRESFLSVDGSVIVSHCGSRIFFEPAREGGRKQRKRFKRSCLRLFELILMNHFGASCRVRFRKRERVYIVQFGKSLNATHRR